MTREAKADEAETTTGAAPWGASTDEAALALVAALSAAPEEAAAPLGALVRHPAPEVRQRALEALVEVQTPATVALAADALGDPDALVRIAAIELLTAQGREEHRLAIWRLAVEDHDPLARTHALLNLSAFEGPLDLDAVVGLAHLSAGATRVACANLLCARGRREWLLPTLEGLFDPEPTTRALTLTLLEALIEPQERPFVRRLLTDRRAAEDAPAALQRIDALLADWADGAPAPPGSLPYSGSRAS